MENRPSSALVIVTEKLAAKTRCDDVKGCFLESSLNARKAYWRDNFLYNFYSVPRPEIKDIAPDVRQQTFQGGSPSAILHNLHQEWNACFNEYLDKKLDYIYTDFTQIYTYFQLDFENI